MRRGDLVTVALQGGFGKPRPALVVQNDSVGPTPNVLLCPLTTTAGEFAALRMNIAPTPANGLRQHSYVMLTNVVATPREKCGPVIGRLTSEEMAEINIRLAFIFGLTGQGA